MTKARLINSFEVPPDRDDEFLAMFGEMNAYMAARPGFLGNRLHRSLVPDARYRFVNYVEWESPAHLRAARDDHYDALRASILAAGFSSTASVYEIVQERANSAETLVNGRAPGPGGADEPTAAARPDTRDMVRDCPEFS